MSAHTSRLTDRLFSRPPGEYCSTTILLYYSRATILLVEGTIPTIDEMIRTYISLHFPTSSFQQILPLPVSAFLIMPTSLAMMISIFLCKFIFICLFIHSFIYLPGTLSEWKMDKTGNKKGLAHRRNDWQNKQLLCDWFPKSDLLVGERYVCIYDSISATLDSNYISLIFKNIT